MNMITRKFSFKSKWDGVVIHGICVVPEKPVAILQMVHGMCEHKERFLSFMQNMSERGYITVMHDNRGHGASVKKVRISDTAMTPWKKDILRISTE